MVTIPLKDSRPILNYAFLHQKSSPKRNPDYGGQLWQGQSWISVTKAQTLGDFSLTVISWIPLILFGPDLIKVKFSLLAKVTSEAKVAPNYGIYRVSESLRKV